MVPKYWYLISAVIKCKSAQGESAEEVGSCMKVNPESGTTSGSACITGTATAAGISELIFNLRSIKLLYGYFT